MAQSSEIKEIGRIRNSSTTIEWKIRNYFSLSQEIDKRYYSPSFNFLDAEWCFLLLPNGTKDSENCIGLCLCRDDSVTEKHDIKFTLGIRNSDGHIYHFWSTKYQFQENENFYGTLELVQKISILENAHEISPDKHLTFFCFLNANDHEWDSWSSDSENEDVSEGSSDTGNTSSSSEDETHTQKESLLDAADLSEGLRDTKNPSSVPPPLTTSPEENQTHTQKESLLDAADVFSNDIKDLLVSERLCDVKIVVKKKELQAHKLILAARSSVFSAMFEHEMTEKKRNIVEILDCEFDVFKEFLRYLYTGKVQEVSEINICGMYVLADKYDVKHLKGECITIMHRSISVDNFCDIISLAVKFNESELLKKATDYFLKNTKSILQTVNWQYFIVEAPTVANELFLKTVT